MTSALARKLRRDIWRLRGLILSAAIVLGAGVALYVMSAGTLASLQATRQAYYARQGMADITVTVRRAPYAVADRAAAIPGVARVDGRLLGAGLLALPGFAEPINALVHSLPEAAALSLNRPVLLRGRLPDPHSTREILVNEAFARAHGLSGGDRLSLVLRGARLDLIITGTAQSPDHTYTIPVGGFVGDNRRLAVLWMPRAALEGPLDMLGAFNQLLFHLERGASFPAVMVEADRLCAPYGGTGAVPLEEQASDKFLTTEMDQLTVMARILPPAFLGVAAFLLWVTISRMITTERVQIGLLKAFGYRNREIGLHYAAIALVVAGLGIVVGILAGRALGSGITSIYADFYQFPILLFRSDPSVMLEAALIGLAAALLGVIGPVRSTARLAPAEAMHPPAPPRFRGRMAHALGHLSSIDEPARMLLRHLLRFPARTLLAGTGVALALSLAIATSFNTDAVARMIDVTFNQASRQTATIVFSEIRPLSATADLARLPGVLALEPFRAVPARLTNGNRHWREALTGMPPGGTIVRPLDLNGRPVAIPEQGLVISQTLAARLDARVGTVIEVEILEGARPRLPLRVAAVVETYQGTPAWIDLHALNRLLLDGPVISGAWALVDRTKEARLVSVLEERPMIAAVTLRGAVLESFQEQVADNLGTFRVWSLGLAAVIVFGVVFTNARLSLSEQGHDLATMRVLGYRSREVAAILIGSVLIVVILAIPAGIALGLAIARRIAAEFSSDLYTIPFAVSSETIGVAALSTLVAAIITALGVSRRVRNLDLLATLKGRE